MMYDCCMRTRLKLVVLIAVGIFGGILLLRYEQSRLAYVPELSGSGHNGPSASSAPDLPVVCLAKDGTLYLNKDMVKIGDLGKVIRQQFGRKVKAVYLRADKDTTFQPIAEVLDVLGAGGFQVKMVTQPRGL
jgi:biopolymer transport protein ExbD